jgi:membrane protease YdiL (CAAX protease family)
VLMQWIEDWTGRPKAALLLSSAAFGLAHLWFGDAFPNWRWVAVATVLGLFCGMARQRAGSIRAGMVTHTLVITLRLFFA